MGAKEVYGQRSVRQDTCNHRVGSNRKGSGYSHAIFRNEGSNTDYSFIAHCDVMTEMLKFDFKIADDWF